MEIANKLEKIISSICHLPYDKNLSDIKVNKILFLLDKCKLYSIRLYLFDNFTNESFELIALLASMGILEKYASLFEKDMLSAYLKLNEIDALRSDHLVFINNYNIDLYFDKLYKGLLPKYQKLLTDYSKIYVARNETKNTKTRTIFCIRNEMVQPVYLHYLFSFKIVDIHYYFEVEKSSYRDYLLSNKIITTFIHLRHLSVEQIDQMYDYAIEQGFDADEFRLNLDGFNLEVTDKRIKNFLTEAFTISEEFYSFAVKLVKKCLKQHSHHYEDELNLLSVKKTA